MRGSLIISFLITLLPPFLIHAQQSGPTGYELCMTTAQDLDGLLKVSNLHWQIMTPYSTDASGSECQGILSGKVPYGEEGNLGISFRSPTVDAETNKIVDEGKLSCHQADAECGKLAPDCIVSMIEREKAACKAYAPFYKNLNQQPQPILQ